MLAHEFERTAEFVRLPEIAGTEEWDEGGRRNRDPMIGPRRHAAMVGPYEREAIDLCEAFRGSVGRAVIDDDQFEIRLALREHRCDRLEHHRTAVVRRNDNADFRNHPITRA